MQPEALKECVVQALDNAKATDIKVLDVRGKTSITDFMVVACGAVDRHVKAVANNVIDETRKAGLRPLGVEGEREGEWVLVDLGDVIVHIMTPQIRDFYQLEKLWMD